MLGSTSFIKHILNNDLQYIKGVGPNKAKAFNALGYRVIKDLLLHLPLHYVDRRKVTSISHAVSNQLLSQIVSIDRIIPQNRSNKITKIVCSDNTGSIILIYFNINKAVLSKLQINQRIVISGKVSWNNNELQMLHPDIVAPHYQAAEVLKIEPIYPASVRMNSKSIAKTISEILNILPEIPEWLPEDVIKHHQIVSFKRALQILHAPKNDEDLTQIEDAIKRLALDEVLSEQILLRMIGNKAIKIPKQPLYFTGDLRQQIIDHLPFTLTIDQAQAIRDIGLDQCGSKHMVRILQGDVGSGKTIVAFASIINAVEAGYQAAIMAPTEILAKQHFNNFQKLLSNHTNIKTELLISNTKRKEKDLIIKNIEAGIAKIIIGTHALIQSSLKFNKLGLAVIDEQHKFGVRQRLDLLEKGFNCDFLMMSATPIPRTLSMIYCNNIDISIIKSKPANRKDIITSVMPISKIDVLVTRIEKEIAMGAKVYWICPLIEESEKISLNNVKTRFEYLERVLRDKVAVLHSKMKVAERNEIMDDFAATNGKIKLVVATTVIEVGVDVPDATIIVIEHAERFGLAQMHQLRGRVGRGDKQSYCILLYGYPVSEVAKLRMDALRQSNDGFFLSEKDLEIRGGGRITNTQQSGLPNFKVYDFTKHQSLLDITVKILPLIYNSDNHIPNNIALLLNLYNAVGVGNDKINKV